MVKVLRPEGYSSGTRSGKTIVPGLLLSMVAGITLLNLLPEFYNLVLMLL